VGSEEYVITRQSLPSAPYSEAWIRDLVHEGHLATLRIRWVEGLSRAEVIHVHISLDGFSVACNFAPDVLLHQQGIFDEQVQKLIRIAEHKLISTEDHAPHTCDCLTR
jgi:glycogen debranching enzyme